MKKLEDLTQEQFYALKKTGVLWEFYPDAPESYTEIKGKPFIVLNRIKTPDGTILTSRGVHDYQLHVDKNGFEYMVDGGFEYLRRHLNAEAPYEDLSLFSDAPFEVLRKNIERGTHGKSGKEKLKWIPVCDMETDHLEACIKYNEEHGCGSSWMTDFYRKELEFREWESELYGKVVDRIKDLQPEKEKTKIPKGGTGQVSSTYQIKLLSVSGWVCPKCGAGLSPNTMVCPCNGNMYKVTCSNKTI